MNVKSELRSLVDELDQAHKGASPWSEEGRLPDFVTAENGMERYFTPNADRALQQLSKTLYQSCLVNHPRIQLEEYRNYVKQAVADMHAAGELLEVDESDSTGLVPKLRSLINATR